MHLTPVYTLGRGVKSLFTPDHKSPVYSIMTSQSGLKLRIHSYSTSQQLNRRKYNSTRRKVKKREVSTVLDFHYFSVCWMLKIVGKSIKIRVESFAVILC